MNALGRILDAAVPVLAFIAAVLWLWPFIAWAFRF